jgi:hypothetical protein
MPATIISNLWIVLACGFHEPEIRKKPERIRMANFFKVYCCCVPDKFKAIQNTMTKLHFNHLKTGIASPIHIYPAGHNRKEIIFISFGKVSGKFCYSFI